jgi:hypothetical protein
MLSSEIGPLVPDGSIILKIKHLTPLLLIPLASSASDVAESLIFANRDEAVIKHGPDRIGPATGEGRPIAEPSERDKLAG